MAKQKTTRAHRRARKSIRKGQVRVASAFNSTMATLTDISSSVISRASAGQLGFRGSRKPTSFTAQEAAQEAAKRAKEHGLRSVEVFVKGPGFGREAATRSPQISKLEVTMIRDITPIPHSGCGPPKRRRV